MYHVTRNIKQTGFTLIEMLVVISIVALIAGASIAGFRNADRSKRVTIAADTVVAALTTGQNLGLASKQIESSTCAKGKAAAYYYVDLSAAPKINLMGVDKCYGPANVVETYQLPGGSRIRANSYQIDNAPVSELTVAFEPPFASVFFKPNAGPDLRKFTSASLIVESTDGVISKQINIDGLSGRIGN